MNDMVLEGDESIAIYSPKRRHKPVNFPNIRRLSTDTLRFARISPPNGPYENFSRSRRLILLSKNLSFAHSSTASK